MKTIILTEKWDDYVDIRQCKSECYLLNKLPKEREYFDYGKDKGYVIQILEEEILEKEYKKYTLYYEKNLDDWNNQIIDVAEVCSICVKS